MLLPFIEDGFECGDKAVHVVSPQRRDIMRTHPLVVGGTLRQNPFFVPPEEFLCELRGRRAAQAGPPAV